MSNKLFISFDIVNSSHYKYNHKEWPKLYKYIFDQINVMREAKQSGFENWKINGDEVLLKKDFNRCSLEDDIVCADCIMREVLRKTYNNEELKKAFPNIKQISLKTTIWIVSLEKLNGIEPIDTLKSDYEFNWSKQEEYFGKEMDTGFRISHFSPRSKTCLSAAVYYVLLQMESKILENIRIIGFVKLKGIWDNRKYPLIVFFRKTKDEDIIRSFHYDEDENEVIKDFIKKIEEKKYRQMTKEDYEEMLDLIGVKNYYLNDF